MSKINAFLQSLFKKEFDPETVRYPEVSNRLETNRKNIYIIGELAGIPLLKTALNNGVDVINNILAEKKISTQSEDGVYDVIIVGLGAGGFSAAIATQNAGLKYIVLESDKEFSTIQKFSKGKIILAEPITIENRSSIWLEETTKEELLQKWFAILNEKKINYKTRITVSNVKQDNNRLTVSTEEGNTYQATSVILAIGKAGNPRKANIPGEDNEKIRYFLDDPDNYNGKKILIYGGGDVAVECAIALSEKNDVTISTIDEKWIYPRKRNQELINELIQQGKTRVHFKTRLKHVNDASIVLENLESKEIKEIPNENCFIMIGAEIPLPFLKRIGIKLEQSWDFMRWFKLFAGMIIAFSIYAFAWKKPPFSDAGKWLQAIFPQGVLQDTFFWYTLFYTLGMLAFGVPALLKWGKGSQRKYTYQKWRYLSLLFFQTFFFFLLPYFIMNDMNYFNLIYAYPLRYDALFNASHVWTIYAFILAFILIPIFVIFHGKRYCTWICACGGLAETVGERWRHLAPKGKKSRKWEIQGAIIFIYTILITIYIFAVGKRTIAYSDPKFAFYVLVTVFGLTSFIPVGLYPVLGGKIWCRYWCPLAKMMEWLSKAYTRLKISRYKIKSYDHCILCGECSRYCEVGIDVMSFAKNEQEINNNNSSCIGCGICVTVCPVDNLGFGSWKENNIYAGKKH